MSHPSSSPTVTGGAVRLPDWGLIVARGADASRFLHGQLTQAVEGLAPQRAVLAGYCSPKGRLLATFVAWKPEPDAVALACSADLLPPTLKRLSMFVLRAQCRLSDASAVWPLWGLAGAEAGRWLGEDALHASVWRSGNAPAGGQWVRLPDAPTDAGAVPRWLWAAPDAAAAPATGSLAPETWAWLEVRSGIARIVAATADHFVPQMVNLELVGGVDFHKGCYPGQEVVARSQYRGTLKRRMLRVRASGALAPGADVFHAQDPGQPSGEVVLAAPAPSGGWEALVEVKLAAVQAGLNLTSGGVDMAGEDLPYAIPTDPA